MTIYVANLNIDTLEDDLTTLFSRFGKITSLKLMKDPYSGVSKGFGFINMEEDGPAIKAIAKLNNTQFMGKTIVVSKAKPRADEKPSGDGYNRKGKNRSDSKKSYNY